MLNPDERKTEQTETVTNRRTVLKLTGSVLGLAALSTSTAVLTAARPGNVIDLGSEGLQPGDDLTPWLEDYWQSGNEVHIPGGSYELSDPDALGISAGDDAWLVGDGDVVADHGDGTHVEFNVESTGDANVRIQNLTLRGVVEDDGDKAKIRVWADDESGLVELVNFNRPDGADSGAHATGLTVVNPHAGMLRLVNCHIEGFTDNGVYASSFAEGDSNDGMGTLEVYGGLYKNNNVNNIRIGGDDAKVVSAVSVVDDIPNGQDPGYRRGIRIREAGENMVIHDCDLYVAGIDGAGPAIQSKDSKFEGPGPTDVTVTDTRVHNDLGAPVIKTDSSDFNISAENLQLTGSGDYELQGDGPFDTVTGSDATEPTTEKRWVDGWGDAPDGGSTDGGSTSTSPSVSTGQPTNVDSSTATLNGSVDDLGDAAAVEASFEHRAAGASEWTATAAQSLDAAGTFSEAIDGLATGSEYEYRALVDGGDAGSDVGGTVSFNTAFDHNLVIQTTDSSGILYSFTASGAIAEVDEESNDTVTENTDGSYSAEGETGNGFADEYYFNGEITAWSAEQHPDNSSGEYELVLDGEPVSPDQLSGDTSVVVSTDAPVDVGETTATLQGTVEELGGASTADAFFEVREAGASEWMATSMESLDSSGTYTESVTELASDTEYEFRAAAEASDGDTDTGSRQAFTTDAADDSTGDTSSGGPAVDRFEVSEAGSPNPHADITAVWDVSDADGDLSWVLVQVFDENGFVVDASKDSVSGDVAADVDYFQIKHARGQTFDVKLTVSDAAGNTTSASGSVSER